MMLCEGLYIVIEGASQEEALHVHHPSAKEWVKEYLVAWATKHDMSLAFSFRAGRNTLEVKCSRSGSARDKITKPEHSPTRATLCDPHTRQRNTPSLKCHCGFCLRFQLRAENIPAQSEGGEESAGATHKAWMWVLTSYNSRHTNGCNPSPLQATVVSKRRGTFVPKEALQDIHLAANMNNPDFLRQQLNRHGLKGVRVENLLRRMRRLMVSFSLLRK